MCMVAFVPPHMCMFAFPNTFSLTLTHTQITYLVQAQLNGIIPRALLNTRIKSTLSTVLTMQDKFERPPRVVDAEMQALFPLPPLLDSLDDDQKAIVSSCRALETDVNGEWVSLPSPSSFVRMWKKFTPPRRGERSVALGKATTTIDCSAKKAAAKWFSVMGRLPVQKSNEQGNPARLLVTTNGVHDICWATIKKMPFPLLNRELVGRTMCVTDTNGDVLITYSPVDDIVDYGMKMKTVRAVSRCFVRFTPSTSSVEQCEVAFHQYLDAGGRLPEWLVNLKMSLGLAAVDDTRALFQRDDEIDKVERDELARVLKDEPQMLTADENVLVNKVHVKLGVLEWDRFEEVESLDHLVRMGKISVDGSSGAVIRASLTVDAPVEECAAWDMCQTSRESLRDHGSLPRSLTKLNDHYGVFHGVYDFNIPGFRPREFLSAQVWRQQGDELTVVYDNTHHTDFPLNPSYVRGSSIVHTVYRSLQPVGGLPQTQVTWTQQVNLGGAIPKFVVNGQAAGQLMYLSTMRKRFDRSLEIDEGVRAQHMHLITGHEEGYSEEETLILRKGRKHFADFEGMKATKLEMKSPTTRAEKAFGKTDSRAWGRATVTVRASPEEVSAPLVHSVAAFFSLFRRFLLSFGTLCIAAPGVILTLRRLSTSDSTVTTCYTTRGRSRRTTSSVSGTGLQGLFGRKKTTEAISLSCLPTQIGQSTRALFVAKTRAP